MFGFAKEILTAQEKKQKEEEARKLFPPAEKIEKVDTNSYDYLFKVVVVGDASVGKSKLMQYFKDIPYTDESLTCCCSPTQSHQAANLVRQQ